MREEEYKNYYTVTQLSNITGNGSDSEKRRLQRKVKDLLIDEPNIDIKIYKNVRYISKKLVHRFDRIYKKEIQSPNTNSIINSEWDIFGDYVPEGITNENVLIAVMEVLTEQLIEKTKQPIKVFYAIEKQPQSHTHVHYMIKSSYGQRKLKKLIREIIDVYCLSDQYIKKFQNGMVVNANNYFNKGIGVNFKNAIFLSSKLITKGKRA